MIEKIKELLSSDLELNIDSERDEKLIQYINYKAEIHLNRKNGGIEDSIVIGWARHFYLETQENIDKEIKLVVEEKEVIKKEIKKPIEKEKKEEQKEFTLFDFEC